MELLTILASAFVLSMVSAANKSSTETLEDKKEVLNSSENKNTVKKENSKLNVDKKELKSTMVNKVQIRKQKIGDFDYNYIWDYYPTRYTDVSIDDDRNRKNVWDFKDGKNNYYFLNLFSNVVENNYEEKENLIIMPIPASTKEDNEIRFKNILMKISDKTKIENGFDYIKVSFNRETKHLSKQVVSKDINYTINAEKIKGKKIILLDDVITTGKGFITLAKNLKELGASSVEGLFLSKTYKPVRCPWCGGFLIKRRGTREFFGCTNYPDCEYEQIIKK